VRAMVKPADFGADKALGPLSDLLGEREPLELGGTLDVVRPGLAEFHVLSVKIRDFQFPAAGIPRLLAALEHGPRPAGIGADAMPLVVPMHIADVRVHNGRITLYKAGP
jgi:hypothetical protein